MSDGAPPPPEAGQEPPDRRAAEIKRLTEELRRDRDYLAEIERLEGRLRIPVLEWFERWMNAEANLERLKMHRTKLTQENERLLDALIKKDKKQQDKIEGLRELLREATEDLSYSIANAYPPAIRRYPDEMRRYESEMDIVHRVRAALSEDKP
jgi:chromosome segregation ATPase